MKYRNLIIIDGEPVDFNSLSKEKREEVSRILNEKAMEQLGYERTA